MINNIPSLIESSSQSDDSDDTPPTHTANAMQQNQIQLQIPKLLKEIKADMKRDIAKVALVERHKGTGGVTMGFVSGFGFTSKCAIASTVAHDSHHMIVVGTDDESMAVAGNSLDSSAASRSAASR